nr:retrovirus-related Pol polyprotein from transposon TNT 1-94 [Tanacetum cinerariifolium]
MQLIQKLRDDKKCMKKVVPSSKSKAIEDIINIGRFVEALILNHYVLVRKILYKDLMNELVNDGINLSKLEINTGFINGLPKKWPSFCQILINTNHVKDSELASLFDSPNDEEGTRSNHEYLNDLEEESQARALLAKSKRVFKKGTQRTKALSLKPMNEMKKKCHQMTMRWWIKVLMALAEDNDVVIIEVCSTFLPPLKKLDGVEPTSGPKTIKLILRSNSTFKAKTFKGVIINEPSSAPAKGNKSSSALNVYSAPAG